MVETKPEREWTIEQETVLFKAICRYKPAGQHKHFRMLCIYQMVNNSNIQSSSPLTIQDIWNKLSTLYNLEGLDELEDSSSFMAEEENAKEPLYFGSLGGSLAKDGTYLRDFGLPWGEFGSLIEKKAAVGESRESSPGYESDKSGGDVPESQVNSDESDAETGADADKGSEAESARNTPIESVKQSTNKRARTPVRKAAATATARTTRSTRQRTAAKKRKEASPTPEAAEESKGDNADEAKEEDTEQQSEKEESPLPETITTARNKRTRTQSKPAAKAKATPSRRSNRRK
jgi:hypothetical protein